MKERKKSKVDDWVTEKSRAEIKTGVLEEKVRRCELR